MTFKGLILFIVSVVALVQGKVFHALLNSQKINTWNKTGDFSSKSIIECGGRLLAQGSINAFSYNKCTSMCSLGNLVPETIYVESGTLVYTLLGTKVWPHLALIGSGTSQRDDLVLPMARSPQITFPPLEPIYQKKYACGMAYQGGLLYCAIVFGICLYHKLGSPGWTQPPELQPNFARQHAGCTVFNGVMWITGGALNDENFIPRNETFLFSNGTWSNGVSLPLPRRGHATVAISDSGAMFCGGSHDTKCWIYDHHLQSFASIAPQQSRKWGQTLGLSLMKNGTKVIVSVGGRYVDIYSHIEVYSFQSNKWTGYESEQTGLNNRLMRVCQFTHEENLYFLGGNYITSVSQNIYLFNPGNVTVTLVGALRQPMICDVTIFFNV